jgi:SPP1 gp7 family putative phage head morphogenesis protein
MPSLTSPTGKPIALKPVRANAGIEAAYRKKLDALIGEMNSSLLYWLSAAYKQSGAMALDASPAMEMRAAMGRMASRWQKNFDKGADRLAVWFAQKNKNYADAALKGILKEAGFTVEFKMTPIVNNAYQAVIGEQVGLIKSIASQHLTRVEGMVMQSVQQGRDLGTLAKQIEAQFGVTKRRAALISRDQNAKATATITKTRQQGLGITQAKWRHSSAGKVPRPEHVHFNGEIYDVAKGMWSKVDGEYIWPGTALNCRCTSAPIIDGFID